MIYRNLTLQDLWIKVLKTHHLEQVVANKFLTLQKEDQKSSQTLRNKIKTGMSRRYSNKCAVT